jgi:hypothetical protein
MDNALLGSHSQQISFIMVMKSFGAPSLKVFTFFAQVWLASLNNDITETNISHCKQLLTPTAAMTFG